MANLAEESGQSLNILMGFARLNGIDNLLQPLPAVVVFIFELMGGHERS
jgi:hypothetical protein